MLKLLSKNELDLISSEIHRNINIELYKHHFHPDVRALVARTIHAPQCYIIDECPDVRLGLIETDKWLDRIAPNESNPKLIIALIAKGCICKKWHRSKDRLVLDALGSI